MKIFLTKSKDHWRPDFDDRNLEFGSGCCRLMNDAIETYNWIRWDWHKHRVSIPIPSSPDEDEDFPISHCPWCGKTIEVVDR